MLVAFPERKAHTLPSKSVLFESLIQYSRARSPSSLKNPMPPARSVSSAQESTSWPSMEVWNLFPRTSMAMRYGVLLWTMMGSGMFTRLPFLPAITG